MSRELQIAQSNKKYSLRLSVQMGKFEKSDPRKPYLAQYISFYWTSTVIDD